MSAESRDTRHPIEVRSYEIMEGEIGTALDAWPEPDRSVVARMVHATADQSFATSARVGQNAVAAALGALQSDAPVICDARMVAAGIPGAATVCFLDRATARPGDTRSAMAVEVAAAEHPDGALWVFGNAPTALRRLLDLYEERLVRPGAVIGLPVGYVGAAEAKADLWASDLAAVSITNTGRRGGSPAAAAAVNALLRLGRHNPPHR